MRIAYGTRISLLVGVVATLIAVRDRRASSGWSAGYFGGIVDSVLAPVMDVMLSIPFLLLRRIALVSMHRAAASTVVDLLVIAFFSWASVARIVRGQVLSIREREYVEAARSLGASDRRIMFVDILPNVSPPMIVYTTLLIPVSDRGRGDALVPRARRARRRRRPGAGCSPRR